MEDVYYIKLVSGEDLVTKVNGLGNDSNTIDLEDPMLVQYFQAKNGTYSASMRPWVPGIDNKRSFTLFKKHTMFASSVENKDLVEFYNGVVNRHKNKDISKISCGDDEEEFDRILCEANNVAPSTPTLQ